MLLQFSAVQFSGNFVFFIYTDDSEFRENSERKRKNKKCYAAR